MRKCSLLLIVGLLIIISPSMYAQINVSGALNRASKEVKKSKKEKEVKEKAQKEETEQEKDYPLLSRFEGAEKVYEKVAKWEKYKLPVNSNDSYLHWEAFTKLEGKIIRYQYKVSPDNNSTYLLKMYKTKLENAGFEIVLALDGEELGISSQTFYKKYYSTLGNSKFGFAFGTQRCRDHSLIIGKITKDGKTVFASIYMTAFDNTTLITQDIIEAEEIEEQAVIAVPYHGSTLSYNDKLGYGEFYVSTGKTSEGKAKITKIEGYIHNRFFRAPKGRSALEIIKNYEKAVAESGGQVLFSGQSQEGINAFMKVNGHPHPAINDYNYNVFKAYQYFCGIIHSEDVDYFVVVAAGKGEYDICYHLVTIETKPMDMDMVSAVNISESMIAEGHIAIYDILFETGKSEINPRSAAALKNIANFLIANPEKQYLIVGHTDNVGDFEANIKLSADRANVIVNELVEKYSVNKDQLKPTGAGSMSPVATNSTDEGKAKNRRVEIVEQ